MEYRGHSLAERATTLPGRYYTSVEVFDEEARNDLLGSLALRGARRRAVGARRLRPAARSRAKASSWSAGKDGAVAGVLQRLPASRDAAVRVRPADASPAGSSARTTPGPTDSTARSSAPPTWTTLPWFDKGEHPLRAGGRRRMGGVSLRHSRRTSRAARRRPATAPRTLRAVAAVGADDRAAHRLRRPRQLEAHLPELLGVLSLPAGPSGPREALPLPERRQQPPRRRRFSAATCSSTRRAAA